MNEEKSSAVRGMDKVAEVNRVAEKIPIASIQSIDDMKY